MTTRKYLTCALLAMFVLAGPIGCGKKEVDELKTKVENLEKELADTNAKLLEADKQAQAAKAAAESDLKTCTDELVKVKVDRDRCRQDLKALKKRR